MRPADKQFIRDIQWLYRAAKDFSNRLRMTSLVRRMMDGEIELDIFESTEFRRVILDPLCSELEFQEWSREKLAKAISLGCTGHYREQNIHIYERLAIDDAIGLRGAVRTPVWALEECPPAWRNIGGYVIPDGRWSMYIRDWPSMNGMDRLRCQAALVIAAAIRDLVIAEREQKKSGRPYTKRLGPAELASIAGQ
jgi:hypothetical protein